MRPGRMVRPHFFQNFFHSAEKSFILSRVKTEVVAASARRVRTRADM